MKYLYWSVLGLAWTIFFVQVVPSALAFDAEGKVYTSYKKNVEDFCQNGNGVQEDEFWKEWRGSSFLRVSNPEYLAAGDTKIPTNYKSFISRVHGESADLDEALSGDGFISLRAASAIYTETMNSVFNCAINTMRIKANKRLLSYKVVSENKTLSRRIEKEVEALKKDNNEKGCREMSEDYMKSKKLKEALLDAATYQSCAYRFYLLYLEQIVNESAGEVLKSDAALKGKEQKNMSTEQMTQQLGSLSYQVQQERVTTSQALKKTIKILDAFEGAYQMHIVLRFLHQDYVDIRESLRKTLFPIGQFIYKAKNAQAPMNAQ